MSTSTIHIVPSRTNILSEKISKRNLNLFSSESIVLAKYFLQDKQKNFKIISMATALVASMVKGPNHALILHAVKGMFI